MTAIVDIDYTRSGGVAGMIIHRVFRNVELRGDEATAWLECEHPGQREERRRPPDSFVYELVFRRGDDARAISMCDVDLDEHTRPLIERLTALAMRDVAGEGDAQVGLADPEGA